MRLIPCTTVFQGPIHLYTERLKSTEWGSSHRILTEAYTFFSRVLPEQISPQLKLQPFSDVLRFDWTDLSPERNGMQGSCKSFLSPMTIWLLPWWVYLDIPLLSTCSLVGWVWSTLCVDLCTKFWLVTTGPPKKLKNTHCVWSECWQLPARILRKFKPRWLLLMQVTYH